MNPALASKIEEAWVWKKDTLTCSQTNPVIPSTFLSLTNFLDGGISSGPHPGRSANDLNSDKQRSNVRTGVDRHFKTVASLRLRAQKNADRSSPGEMERKRYYPD